MTIKKRRDAMTFDGVVRDPTSGAPSEFRIWKAGDNETSHGPTLFTERSAELLMAEQVTKGTRYSIDVNHLSLDMTAPLESQRAVGWFNIDVRDGELWATDCEWVDWMRAGLTADPPEWRYHSPAYDIDVETTEVVSLTNLAITNTPATFHVTALASTVGATVTDSKGTTTAMVINEKVRRILAMSKSDMLAAIDGADEDTKAAIHSALGAQMVEKARSKAADTDEDPDPKDDEPAKKDSDAPEEEKKSAKAKASDDKPAEEASVAASLLAKADARIQRLEAAAAKQAAKDEAEECTSLLNSHEMTKELRASLSSQPLAVVKSIVKALPKTTNPLEGRSTETITASATVGKNNKATTASTQAALLDQMMGLGGDERVVRLEGRSMVFPAMTASEARKAFNKDGK